MTSRNPNGASSIYEGSDGFWHGRVTVGYRDDGSIDRRHVMAKTKGVVVQKVRDLERARDQGQVRRPGQRWTVAAWLDHWLENIARPNLRATSYSAYQVAVRRHLIPEIGKHRLDRLEPEHLERLYRKIVADGGRPGRAHQVHRTIRTALGEAHRRGHVARNVAALARPPRVQLEPIQPYTVDEVRAIMSAASAHPNGARWAIALALGLRQGEVLGLTWSDVDLDAGFLRIRATRHRPTYAHGCGGTCGKAAGRCPQRIQTNRAAGDTKSDAGRRVVGLPAALGELLREHRVEQERWRAAARQLWQDDDWVFTSRGRRAAEPELGLPPLEGTAEGGRRPRRPAPRRPAHGGHRAPGPRRPGAHRDGHHGLVEHRDGGALSARHGPDPAAGRGPGRRSAVGRQATRPG